MHHEPHTFISAGPLIDSRSILEFPSRHSSVVPDDLDESVAIVEHEITFPLPTLFGVSLPHDANSNTETNSAEINFIESLHPFLIAPWL
jgi:hypothetical protein